MEIIFSFKNFNDVKIVLDVSYDKKNIVKEYGARCSQDDKIWYIIHNKDDEYKLNKRCFNNINIILLFKIKEIRHAYYEIDSVVHNELINYYKNLRKKLKNELYTCKTCFCEYKFKHNDKHLLSEEHLNNIKEHENDFCDFY